MRGISRSRLALAMVGLLVALSLAAIAVPVATASRDQTRDFRGKVVSVDRHPKSVKVDTRSGGNVTFRITKQTKFEHMKGFSALKPGLKVEVNAKHRNGGWVASRIDRLGSHSKP